MSGSAAGAGAAPQALMLVDASAPVDRDVHPSGIVPKLQNIVATVNLVCKLDLKNIALTARNAEYNPKVGVIAAQTLMMQCTSDSAGECLVFYLSAAILMQFWCELAFIAVMAISRLLDGAVQRFAAVIMRIREPKTTALIFASGKMVSTEHLPQAVRIARSLILCI